MKTFLLINPNTSEATTARMVDIARRFVGQRVRVEGATAPFGPPLITDEPGLAVAAEAVESLVDAIVDREPDGVVVSAFGDPGLEAARARLRCPVVGIAEAGMSEATVDGQRFSVATTTPDLVAAIKRRAEGYGLGRLFLSVRLTEGDPATLMASPDALRKAMRKAVQDAIDLDAAEAVVIGGGPLAEVAREIVPEFTIPVIEPIPAAIRRLGSM